MAFELEKIQAELRRRGLDGWLLYDFFKRDAIAYRVLGLEPMMVTRRWYYFIPASGAPQKLVHKIESGRLDAVPGQKRLYAAWGQQREELAVMLGAAKKIAMQYSPMNNIPYVSVVDAGTIELVRSLGKEVASSADLVQQFEARWSESQRESHFAAGKDIDEIMRGAFAEMGRRLKDGEAPGEFEMRQWILAQFEARGLTTADGPVVAVNQNSSDPHYEPSAKTSRPIRRGDWVLVDMWAKKKQPGAVYYDITWVGIAGAEPSTEQQKVFETVRAARDAAVEFVAGAVMRGETVRGFQVDDIARGVVRKSGYADYFFHRTGHSIGEDVHSTGVNMDNLETHDDREVMPGICFSVEPGIYLPKFGVRLEVDVYVGENSAGATGAVQTEIVRIPA
ncbi:MAG: M24 family metallopeptidase [Candidatus Acidiferrales bacterium]